MAVVVGRAASSTDGLPRDEDFAGAGSASDDEGEQSDSARSDSTRVPSLPCLENPKTRWADILSDDDEPCACPPAALPPSSCQTSAGKCGSEHEAQRRGAKGEKKARRQRPKLWAEKKAAAAGSASSSSWPQGAGEDGWWGQPSYGGGGWDASWSEWWEPAEAYAATHRASNSWCRGERGFGGAGKWARARGNTTAAKKPQCQFFIGLEEEPKFHVVRRVLGPHGQHMKDIAEKTGAKLRLRGRGSNFLEGPEQQESTDPLMLCVSAPDSFAYAEAKRLTQELLEGIYAEYRSFCGKAGTAPPQLAVSLHEGPREGAY